MKIEVSFQQIGKALRYMRRKKKMSSVALAMELDTTMLLIDIIEQSDTEAGAELCKLLPKHLVAELIRCMEEVSGEKVEALAEAAKDLVEDPNDLELKELTLYVPMTLSFKRISDIVDKTLLMYTAPRHSASREQIARSTVLEACLAAWVIRMNAEAHGNFEESQEYLKLYEKLIEQKTRTASDN